MKTRTRRINPRVIDIFEDWVEKNTEGIIQGNATCKTVDLFALCKIEKRLTAVNDMLRSRRGR